LENVSGQEVDFIGEIEGNLTAFEAKWSASKKVSAPSAWRENYPNSIF
jgi:hypothetical protein